MSAWPWPFGRQRNEARPARCVAVDVETSGLDPRRDRLLAIAAVGVHVDWDGRRIALAPADSFEVVVQQAQASGRDNILLHGIGVQRQREGTPAAQALRAFYDYVGRAPLLAFHAAFDQVLIGRHARAALGEVPPGEWLDIEHLCAATHPEVRARALDEWLDHFGLRCAVRHQAAADTWAECELLQRIWPRVVAECRHWPAVRRLAASHRWVARGQGLGARG